MSSLYKMEISSSEQSLSDKSMTKSSENPNIATYYFHHVSDDQEVSEEEDRKNANKITSNTSPRNEDSVEDNEDFLHHRIEDMIEEDLTRAGVDNISAKKSLTYSKEDIHRLATKAEQMVLKSSRSISDVFEKDGSCEASGETETDDEETQKNNLTERDMKHISLFSSNPSVVCSSPRKRFSDAGAEWSKCKKTGMRKISSMELSSPDMHRISPDVPEAMSAMHTSFSAHSLDSFSQSEDSRTQKVEVEREDLRVIEDSLDEISSGEIDDYSENEDRDRSLSAAISDFWDQENYLSEYNYDEPLDEDNAKKFLNFGDDYRNFIDSMSESQSSIKDGTVYRRIKRRYRKKEVEDEFSFDSQSEAEIEDVFNIIDDSTKKMNCADSLSKKSLAEGFINLEGTNEYTEMMKLCSDNLQLLVHLLQSVDLDDSFISKKKSREIRILLSRWEHLLRMIKDNIHKAEIYERLKKDISLFREDLLGLVDSTKDSVTTDNSTDLETKLLMFKDAMIELSSFKSRLFELNLSVHNFLAELSSCHPVNQCQVHQVQQLKDDVVDLYSLWDRSHHTTLGCLSETEAALRKMTEFQKELLDLRNLLRRDAQCLREKKRMKKGKKNGKNSSSDSGISDYSGGFSDSDISVREEQLTKLKLMANNLQQNLSPNSSALTLISQTLETTSCELKDLQKSYQKYKKTNKKPKLHQTAKCEKVRVKVTSSTGRVVKIASVINILLMFVVFLAWVCEPRCCDNLNTFSYTPQLRYVNGPPPI